MIILNFTQHKATPEQVAAGVLDPSPDRAKVIKRLLTFDDLPTQADVNYACVFLYQIYELWTIELGETFEGPQDTWPQVMIGGAPFLMPELELRFINRSITVNYAFSKRESVENISNGIVVKDSVFRHLGFYTVQP